MRARRQGRGGAVEREASGCAGGAVAPADSGPLNHFPPNQGIPGGLSESRCACLFTSQVPGLSSSEDESLSPVTRRTSLTRVLKHSTPEGAAPSWHSELLGDVSSRQEGGSAGGSPLPVCSPWDLPSSPGGLSPKAPLRKRRLSTIRASEVPSGQLGSNSDPFAFEEDPPVPASVTRRRQQQQQQGRSPRARRSPPNLGLPGIPNAAKRRPRDLKRLAAATERLRQWEIHLLQNIEEATQHELTIEDD
ncbi:coiled-coil domain-containing protein 201 [Megaptera novaeangliae]